MRATGSVSTALEVAFSVCVVIYGVWFMLSYFEDRSSNPPFWRGQFKTFFPGDVFLALAIGFAITTVLVNQLNIPAWVPVAGAVAGFAVGVFLFFVQFSSEEKADPEAIWIWIAPTRVWHQFFVWWAGITLVATFVVPVLVAVVSGSHRSALALLTVVFMAVYVGHLVYDGVHPPEKVPGKPVHAPLKQEYRADWLEELVRKVYPY
ncbi:MAG TPA: hypothetical protein PL051_03405 [Candidatus Saccharibacteria bacterium]|nr:hypothetical protein [Candidatus Saccharibacteria bacterium]